MSENEKDQNDAEGIPEDAPVGLDAVVEQAKRDREEGVGPDEEQRVPFDEA